MTTTTPIDFAEARRTSNWRHGYHLLPAVINRLNLKVGVEVGVACGGHADAILTQCPGVEKLYGVDPYSNRPDYNDLMNLPQETLDAMYADIVDFMQGYASRFELMRLESTHAAVLFNESALDFAYIDAEHTYDACKADIAAWYPLIRPGGVLSGHDYGGGFPGVTRAVDEFVAAHGLVLHVPEPAQFMWYVVKL